VVGCHIMGLGVIRSLHLKKIDTVALHYEPTDIAHWSRYPSETAKIPDPCRDEEAFVCFLMQKANTWGGSLIIPTNDQTAMTVSKNKRMLATQYVVAVPDWEVLELFIDKEKQYKVAEKAGVPCPITFIPNGIEDLRDREHDISYPCVLKPTQSHEFKAIFNRKNFEVHNAQEMAEKYKLCLNAGQPVMVQEIIRGPDSNFRKMQGYVNSKGQIVGKFFLGKLRSNPPPFGVGRVVVSTERDPEVEDLTSRLLLHVGYREGFFSIEFKRDSRDNKLKLIENNVRLVRNNWLATCCGINFPWLIYLDLMEQQQMDIETYTEGFNWIELYSDLFNTFFHHRRENISWREYIRPYLSKNMTEPILSWRDPMPFLKETLVLPLILKKKYFKRQLKCIPNSD